MPAPGRLAYLRRAPFPTPRLMRKLREFYRQYRQYILSDGLMYVVFVVVLGLMFLFFG